ncbi:MAG: FkbM family methyltransferase [Candidatus Methanomethylicaceae archaeon]|jgi:FkbM family methyltransferase
MRIDYYIRTAIWSLAKVKNLHELAQFELGTRDKITVSFHNGINLYCEQGLFSIQAFVGEPYKALNVFGKDVVDVGAFVGDTALWFASQGARRVFALEPYPVAFELLKKNVRLNHFQNIHLLNEALGPKDSSFVADPDFRSNAGSGIRGFPQGHKVKITSLASLAADLGLQNAALKLDCEGCEYSAILQSDRDVLKSFSDIMIECHGPPEPLAIKLRGSGFATLVFRHLSDLYMLAHRIELFS